MDNSPSDLNLTDNIMSNTLNELLAIADFLGDEMNNEQATSIMDRAKSLSISDREVLLANCSGPLYTEASMHDAEMGGLSRY
jgi:hypothetical protein